jgi:ferrochelatase
MTLASPDPAIQRKGNRSSGPGVLLVNLGSPESPRTPEVMRYLREFLWDSRVLDVNPVARALLLHLFILPFRSPRTAKAYQKIWTEEGSPLLVHGRNLAAAVASALGSSIPVALGMRYGKPSIGKGLIELQDQGADQIVVLPLYPQYASSSTGTVLEKVFKEAGRSTNVSDLVTVPPFYDHPGFVKAFAAVGRPELEDMKPDHVIMSFHGLPERHIRRSDTSEAHCLESESCCETLSPVNRHCYRAQCFATSRLLAAELGITSYSVAFQSRMGRTPWIRPHTDVVLSELPSQGKKRVAVFCPSFVADCLETLEEIGIRGRETLLESGGEDLRLIPSLNVHPVWVETVLNLIRTGIRQGDRS